MELAAALAMVLLFPAVARALDAEAANSAAPAPSANALLRQAVENQELLPKSGYLTWMDRVANARGSVTKQMVTTPEGILSRTVAIDDRALTSEERRKDDERIDRLRDPDEMREKARRQRQVLERVEQLLRAAPDAFDCAYQPALVPQHPTRPVTVLACSPKPDYSPPNRVAQVLTGMKAVVTIDRTEIRMTHLAGTLVEDVSFAWGILGKLYRGGRLELRQEKLESGQWALTRMELSVDGRLIVVKPLHIERRESAWDYRTVPAMNVAQALDFLRASSTDTATAAR